MKICAYVQEAYAKQTYKNECMRDRGDAFAEAICEHLGREDRLRLGMLARRYAASPITGERIDEADLQEVDGTRGAVWYLWPVLRWWLDAPAE